MPTGDCPVGTYSTGGAAYSCPSCPLGTYNPLPGQSACTPCGPGFYNPRTGSSLQSDCLPCPLGTYSSNAAGTSLESCLLCPIGTFSIKFNSTALSHCGACPLGVCAAEITLSSYLAQASGVMVTVSFLRSTHVGSAAIRGISISNLRFSSAQPNISCPSLISSSILIVNYDALKLTGTVQVNLSVPQPAAVVMCRISGVTNSIATQAVPSTIVMSSSFSQIQATPRIEALQMQNVLFPEILDPRIVSALSRTSVPHTAHVHLLVYGKSSGFADWSGTVRIAATACATTVWVSNSLVRCRVSSGSFPKLRVVASVLLNRGSATEAFTFSAASASSVLGSAASTGSVQLALFGRSLGQSGFHSGAVRLLMTSCPMTRWVSDSFILLRISSGSANGIPALAVSYGNQNTSRQ